MDIIVAAETVAADNMVVACTAHFAEGTALDIAVAAENFVDNMAVVCIEPFVEDTALDIAHSLIVFVLELAAHKPDSLVVV